jgi:hypothetical protein
MIGRDKTQGSNHPLSAEQSLVMITLTLIGYSISLLLYPTITMQQIAILLALYWFSLPTSISLGMPFALSVMTEIRRITRWNFDTQSGWRLRSKPTASSEQWKNNTLMKSFLTTLAAILVAALIIGLLTDNAHLRTVVARLAADKARSNALIEAWKEKSHELFIQGALSESAYQRDEKQLKALRKALGLPEPVYPTK